MKKLIERVPEILNNLLLCIGKISVNYNETLLKRLSIESGKYNITTKNIKTDFLAIIHFLDYIDDNNDFWFKFYTKDGYTGRYYENHRFNDGYIIINYNYEISSEEFEEKFVINIIRIILEGIGFRYHYLAYNLIRNQYNKSTFSHFLNSPKFL